MNLLTGVLRRGANINGGEVIHIPYHPNRMRAGPGVCPFEDALRREGSEYDRTRNYRWHPEIGRFLFGSETIMFLDLDKEPEIIAWLTRMTLRL